MKSKFIFQLRKQNLISFHDECSHFPCTAIKIIINKWGPLSVSCFRNILADFQYLSGLACNVEKTTLMQFGSNEPVPQNILNLGFDVKSEVKLLGLKIQSNCSNYTAKFRHKYGFGTVSTLVYQVEYEYLKLLCIRN